MCKKPALLILAIHASFFVQLHAQTKQTVKYNQVWLGYTSQFRFSNKWGGWADFHLRTKEDFTSQLSQSIARIGIMYFINNDTKLTIGYAYVNQFPGDNHKNISVPEHRPWQQVQWHRPYPKIKLTQSLRLEERFRHKIANDSSLSPGYNFNWKLRYNFTMSIALSKKAFAPHTFSLVLNNDIHVNFGKQIVYNYFDQNRVFAGFAYHVNAHDNLQLGYMNIFFQLAAGNKYRNINALRLYYLHSLDMRKK